MAESTTSTVSRGFERERRAEALRRSECAGCLDASCARIDEASGGGLWAASGEVVEAAAALRRSACRLRCGRLAFGCWSPDVAGGLWGRSAVAAASLPLDLLRRLLHRKNEPIFLGRGPDVPGNGIEAALESAEPENGRRVFAALGSVHLHRQHTSSRTRGRTIDLAAVIFQLHVRSERLTRHCCVAVTGVSFHATW